MGLGLGPWQVLLLTVAAVVLLVAVAVVLFWLGLMLALAVALAVLNLVYLPGLAGRLRLPTGHLALWLLPVMAIVGWLAVGPRGIGWGAASWLVAVAAPRLAVAYVASRLRARAEEWIERQELAAARYAAKYAEGPLSRPRRRRSTKPTRELPTPSDTESPS